MGKRSITEISDEGPKKKTKLTPPRMSTKAIWDSFSLPEELEDKLDFKPTSSTTDGRPWNLKIVSWNVNGIRAVLKSKKLSYLKFEDADIICLQETKCSDSDLPPDSEFYGYHRYVSCAAKKGYSGTALYSKTKPLSVTYGVGVEEHDNEGRTITAEYKNFFLVNTYVPNAGKKLIRLDYRRTWNSDFLKYLQSLDAKKPVILTGDLNVSHLEIDLANPKTNHKSAGFSPQEREDFGTMIDTGFVDTFRHFYPDLEGAYTFWTYMAGARARNVGWRLDYFIVSQRLLGTVTDNVIRSPVMGSDHCPIVLLFADEQGKDDKENVDEGENILRGQEGESNNNVEDKEAADKEATDKEATDKEATDKEATDKEEIEEEEANEGETVKEA